MREFITHIATNQHTVVNGVLTEVGATTGGHIVCYLKVRDKPSYISQDIGDMGTRALTDNYHYQKKAG